MKWLNKPDKQSITPIYQQIKESVLNAIEDKKLLIGESIPSINKICGEFELAPGTVIRAYDELREMGIISSKQGKGYFVAGTHIEKKTKIFLLFDRMNAFKEILYDSFRNEFDDDTEIQVFFHHYDSKRFEKLVRENLGKFSHYILMPHLHENIQRIVQRIPEKRLIFIDNLPANLHTNSHAVYQDFYNDISNALKERVNEISKYKCINLSLSKSDFQFVPQETQKGFVNFCETHAFQHKIMQNITESNISKNDLYIIFDDNELLNTLKIIQKKGWKLKDDIGIISFDETPMKELLAGGISVLSTDFELMGKTAAELVKGKVSGQIANPFRMIYRNSF
jgi:DNA-binding transcriptional regulator YhcF (GntR family)